MSDRQEIEIDYCLQCRACGSTGVSSTRLSNGLNLQPAHRNFREKRVTHLDRTVNLLKTTGRNAKNLSFTSYSIEIYDAK